ncbi:hypothetical protein F4777DRAFT_267064 [Nemania sp. FL0916]|nr:hypothetical protein F4777DRAFT_267064 [Nemania sp. FL0916]
MLQGIIINVRPCTRGSSAANAERQTDKQSAKASARPNPPVPEPRPRPRPRYRSKSSWDGNSSRKPSPTEVLKLNPTAPSFIPRHSSATFGAETSTPAGMSLEIVKINGDIVLAHHATAASNSPNAAQTTSSPAVASGLSSAPALPNNFNSTPFPNNANQGNGNGSHKPGAEGTENGPIVNIKRETSGGRLTYHQRRKARREAQREAEPPKTPSPPRLTAAEHPPVPASAPPKMEGTVRKFPSIPMSFLKERAAEKAKKRQAKIATLGTQAALATAQNDKGGQQTEPSEPQNDKAKQSRSTGNRPGDRPGWDKS